MFFYLINLVFTLFFSIFAVLLGWYLIWSVYLIKREIVIFLLDIKDGKINL